MGEIPEQDEFEVMRVEQTVTPKSRFWRFIMQYVPESIAEPVEVYAVLTKNLDSYTVGDTVELDVVPTFYSLNNMRIRGTPPFGKPVKIEAEVENCRNSGTGDSVE